MNRRRTGGTEPPCSVEVMYEVANLGLSFGTALTRSGIFRVTESFVMEVLADPDVNARFVASDSYASEIQLARYDRSVNGRLGERLVTAWDNGVSSLEESIALVDRLTAADERDPAAARLRAEVALLNRTARPRSIAGSVDVYHSLRQPLASRDRVPARVRIATIHDMVPSLFPEVTEERFVAFHEAVLRSIDVERDWVMCISESTRRDFIGITRMAEDRIFVVPLAASPLVFRPEEDALRLKAVLARHGVGDGRYVLSLSTLEPRKNLTRLISAFARIVTRPGLKHVRLVLVGALGWKPEALLETIRTVGLPSDRLVLLGHVPDEDLGALLTGASAFAYPSLYEGFGLPVLEAMQCGAPVITSNTSSLPEVVGDAALSVDPTDEDALVQAMTDALLNSDLAAELRRRGVERAKTFTWRRTVDEAVAAYGEMLAQAE
jgi:glycosyltransferase involved in cell wall biosynthesis